MTMKITEMLSAIDSVSDEDLAALEDQIEKKQLELRRLETLRKIIVGQSRKSPTPKAGSGPGSRGGPGSRTNLQREKLALFLINRGGGPCRITLLADELDLAKSTIANLIRHEWFQDGSAGVSISPLGRQVMSRD